MFSSHFRHLCPKMAAMDHYILLIALIVALLSLLVAGMVYVRCRRMKREKDRDILRHIRRQDCLKKELERAIIEKEILRELIRESPEEKTRETGKEKTFEK